MIVERLQHFVRSLNDLTDGTSKKLVFFRIGGVSSSSRIEYEVKGNMVGFNDHVKDIDAQIMRYLRGALDLEVVPNKAGGKNAGMRVDLFMVIWKSLANITEDDAEQLFWVESEVGIVRSATAGKRVQASLRSPFSRFLLDYYSEQPKPVQSLFVDHPEKDAESFYQQLLTLLCIGELECVLLTDDVTEPAAFEPEIPQTTLAPEPDESAPARQPMEDTIAELPGTTLEPEEETEIAAQAVAEEVIEELPDTTLEPHPVSEPLEDERIAAHPSSHMDEPEIDGSIHDEEDEDDYINSLINTSSLDARAARKNINGTTGSKNGRNDDSLNLLFKDGALEDEGGIHETEDKPLDLLSESLDSDELPEHYLGANEEAETVSGDVTSGEVKKEELDELLSSFDSAFDAPLPEEKTTKSQKAKKIAGLQKMLKAAKKGF